MKVRGFSVQEAQTSKNEVSATRYDIRTVQELLGHKDVQTTMVYTHVLNRRGRVVHSPLDRLRKGPSTESGGIIRAHWSA